MNTRPFLGWFVSPAGLVAAGLIAAMLAVFQYSVRAYIPGTLEVGGFTWANFEAMLRPLYALAFWNTVLICFETAVFTLLLAYPLAYTLTRTNSSALRSFILIVSVTPLFLGEVVRTYSWMIVLGNNGFLNTLLLKLGLVDRPLRMMFTSGGVIAALVHVTMPIMVIMLAAALSHIDRNYEKAAESLGAGPIRIFMTITLPLSMPGIVAGFSTAFAWTFSAFATPQLIGGGRVATVSTLIYQLGFSSFNFPFAASLSIIGLALSLAVIALLKKAASPLERMAGTT
ncbi:ABC transporter permease [Tardiphaga robiniae]|uniref:ABC transporter permease n=1 Tax=Tardiphaga robiniae TaxID=943830 RepID=A0A163ZRY0_9BRAD|nr:ABC transporter permease [Tardiphaga robiniae]KZD23789.1 ABC transporter permease [Tardiphaga robiniae]